MPLGKMCIVFGLILTVIGLLLLYVPGSLTWFGRLPGDIRVQREHVSLYIPLTSMILLSLLLTLVANLIFRK